jgi:hypothetical protein
LLRRNIVINVIARSDCDEAIQPLRYCPGLLRLRSQ